MTTTGENVPHVLVMMATYNGAKYIQEQIGSILNQQDVTVSLLISDDRSTDDTVGICQQIAENDKRIVVRSNTTNKGVTKNFLDMVVECEPEKYDYFAFSDQDDYWLPQKLSIAISKLQPVNRQAALYYSVMQNTDENLQNGKPENTWFLNLPNKLKMSLVRSWAGGCTMVFNNKLCCLIQKHGSSQYNGDKHHDGWIHLVARTCGIVIDDHNSYILRRIHGNNVTIESQVHTSSRYWKLIREFIRNNNHASSHMAVQLLNLYENDMEPNARETVKKFVDQKNSLSKRLSSFFDVQYQAPTLLKTIYLRLQLLFYRF